MFILWSSAHRHLIACLRGVGVRSQRMTIDGSLHFFMLRYMLQVRCDAMFSEGKFVNIVLPAFLTFAALSSPLQAETVTNSENNSPSSMAASDTPVKVPIDAFVEPGNLVQPLISPNGQKIVFRERASDKTYVSFRAVDGDEVTRIAFPEKHSLNWYRWAGDDNLLISVTRKTAIYDVEVPISGIFSYNIPTGQAQRLGLKSQGLIGDDVLYVEPGGGYLLLAVSKSLFAFPGVYKVDISNNVFTEIVRPQDNVRSWIADDVGVVRMGISSDARVTRIYYRRSNEEEFTLINRIRKNEDEETKKESLIDVNHIVAGKDDGFVLSNKETGRFALYRFNYTTREIGEKLLDHPENDIKSFTLNDDGSALESVMLTDDRDRIVWFDPVYKNLQRMLDRALPGQEAWIQSRSADGKRMTVYSTSSTDPGSYYIFEPSAKRLHRFAGINDRINPAQMAETKYLRYKARDGLSIPAYLTLPVGRLPSKLPLIVMPHGGPYGIRDTPDYDRDVQFLANRGYAVVQPNFRGSETYGEEFYKKGEGQIGRAMQDDLDDAVDWLAAQGIVDASRVCIVGSSYGGYAALWGVIRNPERYRCAASFAGVTDFGSQLKYSKRGMESRHARNWQAVIRGNEDFELDTVSPAKNANKLDRPILLTHGDDDIVVPISQHKLMVAALKGVGKSAESHIYENEGHGLSNVANQKDWLERLEAFLERHNPAN